MKKNVKQLLLSLATCSLAVVGMSAIASLPKTAVASAEENYSLKFIDTTLIETGFGVWGDRATPTFVTENAISGNAVKVDATATGGFAALEVFSGKTVTAGDTYHIRFKVKGDGTSFHLYQNQEKWELIDDWINTTSEWVEYSYDYTVANTTNQYGLFMCQIASMPSASGCFYIDDMSVEKTKTVVSGSAIGELPALNDEQVWKIDGKEITAETVWDYTESKTAVVGMAAAKYSLKFVDTTLIEAGFGIWGDATPSFVEENAISGNALKVEATTTGVFAALEVFPNKTVTAGETYHIRFKVKGDGTQFHLFQNQEKWELIDDWINTTSEWVEYSYDYTVANTTNEYGLFMCQIMSIPSTSGCFYIEDLSVEKTKKLTEGSVIDVLPAIPEKEHYTGAWTIDGKAINADMVWSFTDSKTAKIEYTPIEYTVEFKNGDDVVGTQTYTVEDTEINVPEVPTKEYYTGAWESYELGGGDKTVNAVYTANEYTVTFKNGDDVVGTQTYTVEDAEITVPEVPAKEHYTGVWESYELGGGNKTVNAVYTAIEYTVEFKNGEDVVGTQTYTVENTEITAPEVPAKEHYTGVWESYELGGGDKTVNAVYTAIEYTVTFMNGEEIVATQTYTVENTEIAVPEVPEKEGYTGAWESYELGGGDKTVNAVYTEKPIVDDSSSEEDSSSGKDSSSDTVSSSDGSSVASGCSGSVSGAAFGITMLGVAVVALLKKKEN